MADPRIPKAFLEADQPKPAIADVTDQMLGIETPNPTLVEPGEALSEAEVSKLDTSWLPFAAQTYKISPRLEDYVIMNMPMMPSDIPNRNGVAFPLAELVKYQPPPMNRQVFKAWAGCPIHLEHESEDHEKALGVVFDTSLRQIKGYNGGKHYMVYGLIGIDKTKYPEIAEKLLKGELNTSSMGCMADNFTCSVCGHEAKEEQFMNCAHISSTKNVNWRIVDHEGQKKLAYLNAHGLSPIEHSIVADPAWCMALTDQILAGN